MAWAFVGVSNVVEVTAASHPLVTTGISGLAAGDLLVACISSRIASTTSVTLPTGGAWTLVGEQKANNTATNNSATPSALMAYAIRGASDPNLTFTHPTAPSVAIGRIVAYRGTYQTPPLGAAAAFTTASNTTAVSGAGLTTVSDNALLVAMVAGGQEAAWSSFNATSPSGASGATSTAAPTTAWLERGDTNTATGADTSLAIFDAVKTTIGATGNLTATASIAAAQSVIAASFKTPEVSAVGAAAGVGAVDAIGGVIIGSVGTAAGASFAFTTVDENLFDYSEDFSQSYWVTSNASISSDAVIAPDGETTADTLIEDTASSNHRVYIPDASPEAVGSDAGIYTASLYAKEAGRSRLLVAVFSGDFSQGTQIIFNLSTVSAAVSSLNNTTLLDATIEAAANGFYRVSVTTTLSDVSGVLVRFSLMTASSANYTGDGTSGMHVWGAQLNRGALIDYIKTPSGENVGTASGAGAATAISEAISEVVGTALGTGEADAVGEEGIETTIVSGDGLAVGAGAAVAVGAEVTILRPDGDTALDGWSDQADGTTNIYQSIDEVTLNDSDYVQSPSFASADADLVVRLFDGATEIAEWTHSDIADTFVTAEQTLTTPQFEAITNFSDLFVELDDNQGSVYRFPVGNPASGVSEPVKLRYRYKKLAA